jgi:hypothetical protein
VRRFLAISIASFCSRSLRDRSLSSVCETIEERSVFAIEFSGGFNKLRQRLFTLRSVLARFGALRLSLFFAHGEIVRAALYSDRRFVR